MQLVLMLIFGATVLGLFYEKLDRKAYISLVGLVVLAIALWLYSSRFL